MMQPHEILAFRPSRLGPASSAGAAVPCKVRSAGPSWFVRWHTGMMEKSPERTSPSFGTSERAGEFAAQLRKQGVRCEIVAEATLEILDDEEQHV